MDQRAETELGRLVLRGTIDATLGLAGETYLGLWRGYVWTLAGPRELAVGDGHGFSCGGCEQMKHCRCWFRREVFGEAFRALRQAGGEAILAVSAVVLGGFTARQELIEPLRLGLSTLAHHFGLTPRANSISQKCSIPNHAHSG